MKTDENAECGSERFILHQPFLKAAKSYHVFNGPDYTAIVPYKDGEKLIEKIRELHMPHGYVGGDLLRSAQRYAVAIYGWQMEKLKASGMVEMITNQIYAVRPEAYVAELGLLP